MTTPTTLARFGFNVPFIEIGYFETAFVCQWVRNRAGQFKVIVASNYKELEREAFNAVWLSLSGEMGVPAGSRQSYPVSGDYSCSANLAARARWPEEA